MANYMAVVYANLIRKDKKTFKAVPPNLKEQVRQLLIEMGREDLIVEDEQNTESL